MSLLPERVELKTPEQIAVMRRSGKLMHRVHDMLAEHIRPGITTDALDTPVDGQQAQAGRHN